MFMLSCSVRISGICFRCEAVMVCICRRTEMMGCFVSLSMLAYKLYVHQGCVLCFEDIFWVQESSTITTYVGLCIR
jgi:hypothetical protein